MFNYRSRSTSMDRSGAWARNIVQVLALFFEIEGFSYMYGWLNLVVFIEKKLQSGNCSIQIGKILLKQQFWGDAAKALENGIAKGNLDDLSEASALLKKCHGMMCET